jgi:predicted N-acyltransferase
MLTARQYKSIHEINTRHWDSILDPGDIFHTYRFISLVEDSKVENADFYYLLIYDKEQLVATAVFSTFTISLDLFISNNVLVRSLKKFVPGIFRIKILTCGLPASFGQLNFKVLHAKYADEVSAMIATEMRQLAKQLRIQLLTLKEFTDESKKRFKHFEKKSFFVAHSIPYMNLEVVWPTFAEYLAALRHPYRRKIIGALKKIGQQHPVIIQASEYDSRNNDPALVLSEPDEQFAMEFYTSYRAVMERTPTKLEILNYGFFKKLFQQKQEYRTLSLIAGGKAVSSAVLTFYNDTLVFMLVGREKERDKYDSYYNLIYGIIQLAIQGGYKRINMGQTAYWVKQCVGAVPEPEYIYLASRNPVMHRLLRSLRDVIFPKTVLQRVHVFREPDTITKSSIAHEEFRYNE